MRRPRVERYVLVLAGWVVGRFMGPGSLAVLLIRLIRVR